MINIFGDQRFGANDDVDRNRILGEQAGTTQILGGADARDLGRGMKNRRCDLAGDHVDFITVGQGDNHVGVVGTGVIEQPRVGTVAANRAQIEPILQFRQNLLVGIDDGYFVALFLGELSCYRRAYLPGA